MNIFRHIGRLGIFSLIFVWIFFAGCGVKNTPSKKSARGLPPETVKFLEEAMPIMGGLNEGSKKGETPTQRLEESAANPRKISEKLYALCSAANGVDPEVTLLVMDYADTYHRMADDLDQILRTKNEEEQDRLLKHAELRAKLRMSELQLRFAQVRITLKERYDGKN